MPVASKTAKGTQPGEIDLLAEIEDSNPQVAEDEDFDLLSEMSESDAQAWIPWNEDDHPRGLQGTVLHIGTVTQDAKYGGEDVPYIELRDKDGAVWGIRGYATVLESQMNKEIEKGLRTGDIFAVVYKGETTNRKGDNTYKNFGVKSLPVGR